VQVRRRILWALGLLLGGAIFFSGCKHFQKSSANERRFPIDGRVVAVDPASHTLTLDHHEIPGFMKAMTMPFTVDEADAWVFNVVHPGDTVQATLVVGSDTYLNGVSVTESRGEADLSSTSPVHLPQMGEAVPDFHFTNQNDRRIHLAQFRGEPLLVTFIYTRCPLPDYCVRMSNNFVEIARTLKQSNPAAFAKLQMLSITLDPSFDDPHVLRGYGKGYIGAADPGLKHWTLATGSPAEIRKAAQFFGLSYEQQNGQVVHNLRTTLIDPNGKVFQLYSGNGWKPADVAAQLVQLQR
jgi:protein SCO1